MKDYDVFKKWLGGVLDLIWGTPSMAKKALEKEMMKKDIGQYVGLTKPKRARGKKGRYLADDPTTKGINEAWVGGKAPKKGKK